ncbi:hypothetical protein G3554_07475 [Micromonospora sp. PPF5-17]|uniref:Uncharacterized protein n=1 Tax=Micromonospora solifontis TaxID=2487138 RepID=A0ABX9WK82_9ACTN|nr:hypothetical protein [Micromonospora sp. PPF5-17B]NES36011.1 hypothetical protein [Micromonospora solifontis]NES56916.1 hypothetical protein [Micromonospora sp. PPF5-6]RNM00116.1 hypothetical protein EFE23_07500 [Micromonospora solifontis]
MPNGRGGRATAEPASRWRRSGTGRSSRAVRPDRGDVVVARWRRPQGAYTRRPIRDPGWPVSVQEDNAVWPR